MKHLLSLLILSSLIFAGSKYFKNTGEKINAKEESDFDYFYEQRSFPYNKIDYDAYQASAQQFKQQLSQSKFQTTGNWQFAGPVNIGGRITDIEFDPANTDIAYLAAASGGIFKTTDDGATWTPIFDAQTTLSMGDIAIAPSNGNIIYAGTGEANGGSGSLTYDANGIYKSTDAGVTWTNVGLTTTRMTGHIAVHPANPDIVFAATMGELYGQGPDRGLYRTSDGGITWTKVLFLNDSTGAIDVVINPQNPLIVYAAMWERVRRVNDKRYYGAASGLYKSADGGITWSQLTNGLPVPGTLISRIGIDLCAAQPNVVYAKFLDQNYTLLNVYKSVDNGNTWVAVNSAGIIGNSASQGYWYGKIKVDPVDPDIVYDIGFDMYKTTDGGINWVSTFTGIHVDQHAIAISPADHNFVMNGCDGGLHISGDGGDTWFHQDNLPITQFYTCELDNTIPASLYGGTQDNNCIRTNTGLFNDWEAMIGGDGFYNLVDPVNNNYIYCEYQYGNLFRSDDGGFTFNSAINGISGFPNWNCPVVFDPQDPQTLYYGAQQVFRTDDRGNSWSSISPDLVVLNANGGNLLHGTISTIDVSPLNSDIIYAGTDDGKVWNTANGGASWNNVTGTLPQRWVTHISCDPFVSGRAYVSISGYRFHDNAKHIYMTGNSGSTWTDISSNLPDVPMNDIVADPAFDSVLYSASDVGVYYTGDLGGSWQPVGGGMPTLVCMDIKVHNPTRTLLAATYGRGLYKFDLNIITGTILHANENLATLSVSQNPVNENSTVSIYAEIKDEGEIRIFDTGGKLIVVKPTGILKKGLNHLRWSDIAGRKIFKPGIYFCNFKSASANVSLKVMVD